MSALELIGKIKRLQKLQEESRKQSCSQTLTKIAPPSCNELTPDPVAFAQSLGFEPDPWQSESLRSESKRVLLNCSRQAGKSTVASVKAFHRLVYYPKSLTLLVSPSDRQSAELLRKVRELFPRMASPPALIEDNKHSLELVNGARIVSLPGKADTIRGFSAASLIIEDEAAKVPDDLYRTIRPMLAVSGGALWLMSTPFGKRGHFFEAWEGALPWDRQEIPATACPRISPEFLEEERATLGDWWFQQEYMCEFGETVGGMFRHDDIVAAFATAHEELPEWLTDVVEASSELPKWLT